MDLKWRFMHCDESIFLKTGVELKLNLLYEAWNVFVILSTNIATPCIQLILLHLLTSIDSVSAKDDWLMDQLMASWMFPHYTASGIDSIVTDKMDTTTARASANDRRTSSYCIGCATYRVGRGDDHGLLLRSSRRSSAILLYLLWLLLITIWLVGGPFIAIVWLLL